MPLIRYFVFAGSLLLAMLLMADRYWPDSSQSFMREARVDKSIIRIHTAHRWPEAIAFDTSQPTIVPPPLPLLANVSTVQPPREAYAQLNEPPKQVSKPVAPPKAKRKLARRAPATRVVAAYPEAPQTFFARW